MDLLDLHLVSILRGLHDIILSVCNSVKSLKRTSPAFSQKLELTQKTGGEICGLLLQGSDWVTSVVPSCLTVYELDSHISKGCFCSAWHKK